MENLFTYQFVCTEKFNAEAYLESLIAATKDNRLYLARNIDQDGLFYDVAEKVEDMNAVSVVAIDWTKCDKRRFLFKFDYWVQEIEKNKGAKGLYPAKHYPSAVRAKQMENRVDRLSKLLELGAPEIVIEKEKQSLLEEMAFVFFAQWYQDVLFVQGANPPEKGSRADLANQETVQRFVKLYERVARGIEEGVSLRIADLQKNFQMGYSVATYLLSNLQANGFLVDGKFAGRKIESFEKLKIDGTPYDKDTKFLDELTEAELLKLLENKPKGDTEK